MNHKPSTAKKLLFIDDETSLQEIAELIFDEYQVSVTSGAEDILALVSELLPDIILLDINLGNVDGRDVCRTLKTSIKCKHIPIILMSAGFIREEDMSCGADAVQEKPFDVTAFQDLVQSMIH